MNMKQTMTGSKIRAAKARGVFAALSRVEKAEAIKKFETVGECKAVALNPENGKWVQRQALRRAIHLGLLGPYTAPTMALEVAARVLLEDGAAVALAESIVDEHDLEFRSLVEKFREQGKPNPEKSARASMAARKGNAKRSASATA